MNTSDLITLTDLLAHRDIDDRLDRIQRDAGYVSTTRNTVHAPSPLKTIGETLDEVMCVPTDPPSTKIQILAGKFWCRGALWGFPGATSTEPLQLAPTVPTFAYVGIKLDRVLNTMELFVEKTSGFMPFFHPDVFPVAFLKIPADATRIIEDYILDIRPFLNYDISIPKDKIVVEMECLAAGESQIIDLGRLKGSKPLIAVYQKVANAGRADIHNLFESEEKMTRLDGSTSEPYYDATFNAATLPPRVAMEKVDMPATENVIFVSAIRGTTNADGTKSLPFTNIPDAVDRVNGMPGYDTIFVEEGVYSLSREMEINTPVKIIGESPNTVIIRMLAGQPRFGIANEDIEFRTIQFHWSKGFAEASCCIEAMGVVRFYNCIFKPTTNNPTAQFLISHTNRYVSNCVMFDQYTGSLAMLPRFYLPQTGSDTWIERIENNIMIGQWGHTLPSGPAYQNLFDTDVTGVNLKLEDNTKFYPADDSPCIDQGMITLVGPDKDGTRTDIGLYGGGYASQARVKSYSVRDIIVWRYTYMTMFAPSLKQFLAVTPLIGFSLQQANIRCAVSFDGGHTYVAWKETLGAWAVMSLDKFQEQGNTPQDLAQRLVNMGEVPSRGEIVIAWCMWTTDAKYTPIVRGMNFTIQADGDAMRPIWPDKLDMLISSDSLLISNMSADRIQGLTIVIY